MFKPYTFRCLDCGAGTDWDKHATCGFCGGPYVHKSDYWLRYKTFDNPPAKAAAAPSVEGRDP